jgi:long-chain acyl-CoA synthetase
MSHSSTLTGELLVALKTRTKLVIAPVIVPPRYALNNINKFQISIICLNPTLLSTYAEECRLKKYNLSSLQTIYVSGSVLIDKIYNLAHEIFKNIDIYNVYGLSEASPRVTAQRADCCKTNSVGKPIKGIDIAIVDDNGNIVECGKFGIIHVDTPSRFAGYISGDEKHSSLYQDWLNTGDVGYFDKNDELHIVNRIDDVIIIDSHKIYPSDVEKQIMKYMSISECIVVKLENKGNEFIGCLYVGTHEVNNIRKSKLDSVLMTYEIPLFFLKCESMPRTLNGKISIKDVVKLLTDAVEKEIISGSGKNLRRLFI